MRLRPLEYESWNFDEGKPLIEWIKTGDDLKIWHEVMYVYRYSAVHSAYIEEGLLAIFK